MHAAFLMSQHAGLCLEVTSMGASSSIQANGTVQEPVVTNSEAASPVQVQRPVADDPLLVPGNQLCVISNLPGNTTPVELFDLIARTDARIYPDEDGTVFAFVPCGSDQEWGVMCKLEGQSFRGQPLSVVRVRIDDDLNPVVLSVPSSALWPSRGVMLAGAGIAVAVIGGITLYHYTKGSSASSAPAATSTSALLSHPQPPSNPAPTRSTLQPAAVYTLNQADGKKYVGMVREGPIVKGKTPLDERMDKHFSGNGAQWSRRYPPESVGQVTTYESNEAAKAAETATYYAMKALYGADNVRGAGNTRSY